MCMCDPPLKDNMFKFMHIYQYLFTKSNKLNDPPLPYVSLTVVGNLIIDTNLYNKEFNSSLFYNATKYNNNNSVQPEL